MCLRQRCNYTFPKPGLPIACPNSEPVEIKDAKVITAIALFFRWSHLAIALRIVAYPAWPNLVLNAIDY